MGRADPFLAAYGVLSPQPSAGQDQERDRAGRQVYDPSGSGAGEAIVPGARGQVGYRYGQDRAEQDMMDYLEFIARVTSHIPDKGQVFVRYYGLYANAHRGKVRKAAVSPLVLRMAEEELKPVPSKGWAAMIRKVYEIDPMLCPKCGGQMKVIAFITDYQAVDRIIEHLKLRFVAEKPPPSRVFEQVALMAAEAGAEFF